MVGHAADGPAAATRARAALSDVTNKNNRSNVAGNGKVYAVPWNDDKVLVIEVECSPGMISDTGRTPSP